MEDLQSYDYIIDARSPREYLADHLPGAVNLPVVFDDEYAEVGTLHRTDAMAAYLVGVRYSMRNIANHLEAHFPAIDRKSRILVYCFRGGKRSKLWMDALNTIGYRATKLEGGWKSYRRWVNAQLEELPKQFNFCVLNGPTGCGKTRLLYALEEAGEQVLDLEQLASHRGSIIGAIPDVQQPSQKYFDTLLIHRLSQFDASKRVWVEAESKKVGNVQLPKSLMETMQAGQLFQVAAEMKQRVQLWREDYKHFEEDPDFLIERLSYLKSLVGNKELAYWEALADAGRIPELFERLMVAHYDIAYRRSSLKAYPELDSASVIHLVDLSPAALLERAKVLQGVLDGTLSAEHAFE